MERKRKSERMDGCERREWMCVVGSLSLKCVKVIRLSYDFEETVITVSGAEMR